MEKIELNGDQLSGQLADLVLGDHEFSETWDHQQRVMAVSQLLSVYNMVRELGELEHTSDWDWRISVEAFVGGRTFVLGTDFGDQVAEDDPWADTFRWPESYSVEPHDYTTGFEAWKFIEVEEFPSSDSNEPKWAAVSVDHITNITISFA